METNVAMPETSDQNWPWQIYFANENTQLN